jgi:hypothetical protein
MGKVFVTQENPGLNYMPAEEFGEIVFLTGLDFSLVKNSLANIALVEGLKQQLAKFRPEEDSIVVTGSPVVAAAVFMILASFTSEAVVLHWSNRDRAYRPITVSVS